ncbi:TIGR01777 family oxidoreductase [Balneatrix alpica]|uniref:TIGR01777 family oxidoreductase n=1 Tax=Balneatrix alpica TaxID=75684 RepID=A0ABV5Z6M6_9GAMM|nr:TIGR01777 family oxidoreductase [Balneatrix alpica]
MRVLITGATGFLGCALVAMLTHQGHELVVWVRNLRRAREMLGHHVRAVEHLAELDSWRPEAVINLAGEPILGRRWSDGYKQRLLSSRVGLTRELVAWLAQGLAPAVMLSGSAIGYYGLQPATVYLDESSPGREGFTHKLCQEWEEAALLIQEQGTRVCLLRTGVVLGMGGGALAQMLTPFRLGLGGPVASGQQMMSWIHLQDWLDAVNFLLARPTLSGPFNLVSPNPVTNAEFSQALAHSLRRPGWMRMPEWLLRLLFAEGAEVLVQGQRVLPARLQQAGFKFAYPKLDRALGAILGHRKSA